MTLLSSPDIEGFRRWLYKNKDTRLREKLMTEAEAVKLFVKDGDYLGFELYGTVRCPLSLVREVIRQGKKNLRLVGQGLMDVDWLLAASRVTAMDITYVGYEAYGPSPILRRAVEEGQVRLIEWSNGALAWRFKAASMGVPFLPSRTMLGSDTLKFSGAKVIKDPFMGGKISLLPALILDCGVIHVHRADPYGNCQIDGISGFAAEMAGASKRLIVSAEEIIDTKEIRKRPDRTIIPYYLVDAVVHAPYGSHPGEMCYLYQRDEAHIRGYLEAIKTKSAADAYLKTYIFSLKNHKDYLDLIGGKRLKSLKI